MIEYMSMDVVSPLVILYLYIYEEKYTYSILLPYDELPLVK